MRTINTALLAFGMSGKLFHAPFISCNKGFNFMGAWEHSHKNMRDVYPKTRSYSSLEELLNDNSVELVVVNTPTYTHFDYARLALEAGKNVIVEKAFACDEYEAKRLKELAMRVGRHLAVYQNRRWDSDFLTVKSVIDSGKLGDIKEVEIHYDRYDLNLSPKPHKEEQNHGSGIVKDLGSHCIDQAIVLFGMPQAVFADIRVIRPASMVDDCAEILLYYPDLRVRIRLTLVAKEPVPAYIVHGTNGSFIKSRADVQEEALEKGIRPDTSGWGVEPESERGVINYLRDGATIRERVETKRGDYMKFYNSVYKAITEHKPMPVTADDGLRVVRVIDAAMISQAEKRVIEL